MRFAKIFVPRHFSLLAAKINGVFCVVSSHVHVLQKSAFGKQKIMRRQCNFFEIA